MERRAFLVTLAAVMSSPTYRAAALVRDFGVPGTVTFDAAHVVWRQAAGNYLVAPEIVAREALAIYHEWELALLKVDEA